MWLPASVMLLVCKAAALHEQELASDDVSLVQSSLRTGQPGLTFDVGESAEVQGSAEHAGEWIVCAIKSKESSDAYTVSVPGVGDVAHVPAALLRKARSETGVWLSAYGPGERAEVKIAKGAFAGFWVQCNVLSQGQLPNTYLVNVPSAKAGLIPDVPATSLRKLDERPPVAGCSTVDRMQAAQVFSIKGVMVFAGWANNCENFLSGSIMDYQKLDACMRRVLPVSPKCSKCATDFAQEALGPCKDQCAPTLSSCTDFTSPSSNCTADMAGCMRCTRPAVGTLLRCVGIDSAETAGRLDQVQELLASGRFGQPAVDGIFASVLDGLVASLSRGAGGL